MVELEKYKTIIMWKKITSKLIVTYISILCALIPCMGIIYAADWNTSDIKKSDYMINVSDLNPWEANTSTVASSPKDIISSILEKITQMLLIVIPALASIFIVVWGIKMITSGWDSSKISSAKNIITYNIIAVVISLLSYSIIQLIVWLLWSTS